MNKAHVIITWENVSLYSLLFFWNIVFMSIFHMMSSFYIFLIKLDHTTDVITWPSALYCGWYWFPGYGALPGDGYWLPPGYWLYWFPYVNFDWSFWSVTWLYAGGTKTIKQKKYKHHINHIIYLQNKKKYF